MDGDRTFRALKKHNRAEPWCELVEVCNPTAEVWGVCTFLLCFVPDGMAETGPQQSTSES